MSLGGPAAARLFDEHVDAVHAYVARRIGVELASDVVGEVFEQALRTHDQFVERNLAPKGGERGWLLAIATALLRRHAAVEDARLAGWEALAHRADPQRSTTDPLLRPADSPHPDREPAVMHAVGALDPADRDLLLLTAWEGCTGPVAGEAARIAPGTVKSRLHAIRDELRERVTAAVDDGRRIPNPLAVVAAARPPQVSMPDTPRRHLRERLFEVATSSRPELVATTVSTVPAADRDRRSTHLRLVALLALVLAAVGGLALASTRDDGAVTTDGTADDGTSDDGTADAESTIDDTNGDAVADTAPAATVTIPPLPEPSFAPTTTTPPVAGSPETPLLLPPERSRLESLVVTRASLGGSSLLLRAPDQSTLVLTEADGLAPVEPPPVTDPDSGDTVPTTLPRAVGSLQVSLGDEPGRYEIALPCGSLQLSDAADRLPFRPAVEQLLTSIALVDGAIRLTPPPDWVTLDRSPSVDAFEFGVPVDVGGRRVVVTLTQYPGGGIALPAFGGSSYSPTTFLGQQAWISRQVDDPSRYEVLGRVGATAVSVRTTDLALAELEGVLASFTPGSVDDWVERFGVLPTRADPDIRRCEDQPEFVLPSP